MQLETLPLSMWKISRIFMMRALVFTFSFAFCSCAIVGGCQQSRFAALIPSQMHIVLTANILICSIHTWNAAGVCIACTQSAACVRVPLMCMPIALTEPGQKEQFAPLKTHYNYKLLITWKRFFVCCNFNWTFSNLLLCFAAQLLQPITLQFTC